MPAKLCPTLTSKYCGIIWVLVTSWSNNDSTHSRDAILVKRIGFLCRKRAKKELTVNIESLLPEAMLNSVKFSSVNASPLGICLWGPIGC